MNSLNEVIIEGHLVREPELRWIKEGEKAVCRFTVAVNKRYKDRSKDSWIEDTSYFLVESWKGLAATCSKYLQKGTLVRVVGELKQSLWKEKDSEKTRERVYIIAEHVEFKLNKKDGEVSKGNADISEEDNLYSKDARTTLDKEAEDLDDVVLPF